VNLPVTPSRFLLTGAEKRWGCTRLPSITDQRRLTQPGQVIELTDQERRDVGPADRAAETAAVQ
jgi:hypothetical protein